MRIYCFWPSAIEYQRVSSEGASMKSINEVASLIYEKIMDEWNRNGGVVAASVYRTYEWHFAIVRGPVR